MKTRRIQKPDPNERYEEARRHLLELADEIVAHVKDCETENADWSDVGSMQHYRDQVQEISDSMFARGEFEGDKPYRPRG